MGLDNLVDDEEEQQKEEKTEEKAEEIGVEDKEELEELDDRLSNTFETITKLESRVESLENELNIHKAALSTVIDAIEDADNDDIEMEELSWDQLASE